MISRIGSTILKNCQKERSFSIFLGSSNRSVKSLDRVSSIPEGFTKYSMQFRKKSLLAYWYSVNWLNPICMGPLLFVTTLVTMSASEITIILLEVSLAGKNGCLYKLDNVSARLEEMRLVKTELNFPSSKTATGTWLRLKVLRSSWVFILFKETRAGVLSILAFSEEASNIVFLIPSDFTVSIELGKMDNTLSRFLAIG